MESYFTIKPNEVLTHANNMDESWRSHAKWNQSVTKGQICDFVYEMFRTVKSRAIESRVVVSYGWHQERDKWERKRDLKDRTRFLIVISMMKQPKMECSGDCVHEHTKMITNTLKCKLLICLEYIYIAYFKWMTYHMNYVWLEQLCSKQHSRYIKNTQQLNYGLLKKIFNMSYCLKRAPSFYCKVWNVWQGH